MIASNPWTVCLWFFSPDSSTGSNFDNIFNERDSTGDDYLTMHLKTSGGVNFFYRPGGFGQPSTSITSSAIVDDLLWHTLCFVHRSTTDRQAYIDFVSAGADTTSITNSRTPLLLGLSSSGSQDLPAGAKIANVQLYKSALTLGQMKAAMYGFRTVKPHAYFPLGLSSPEVDWSGLGVTLNKLNTSVNGNPPIGRLF